MPYLYLEVRVLHCCLKFLSEVSRLLFVINVIDVIVIVMMVKEYVVLLDCH